VDERVAADFVESVKKRLTQARFRIDESAKKAGRDPAEVTLVAVTKSLPLEHIPLLDNLGLNDFAENRPQELARRCPLLPAATWHMIGHLQRNKVPQVLDFAKLIHSVDSLKLLGEIEAQSAKRSRTTRVLIQINGSREPQKGGFDPDKPGEIVQAISGLRNVVVEGLMTMAADTGSWKRSVGPTRRRRWRRFCWNNLRRRCRLCWWKHYFWNVISNLWRRLRRWFCCWIEWR
jgi:pyridoxal phosphate enzyme (YggS family)